MVPEKQKSQNPDGAISGRKMKRFPEGDNDGSFYERYKAKEAFSISQRLDIRHTPKHGSWLNIAECELSVLTRQCLQHERYKTLDSLNKALSAWNIERNTQQKTVSWQFTTDDARIKIKALYPLL